MAGVPGLVWGPQKAMVGGEARVRYLPPVRHQEPDEGAAIGGGIQALPRAAFVVVDAVAAISVVIGTATETATSIGQTGAYHLRDEAGIPRPIAEAGGAIADVVGETEREIRAHGPRRGGGAISFLVISL